MPTLRSPLRPAIRETPLSRAITDGGGGFSPLSLFAAGEQGAWYDPSDISTLFQDAAGTTPVTASGQPVGKMLDKSGRGNHATQATAANRPTLQQDSGGRYYLSFDGVNDALATAAINFSATDKVTLFAAFRKASDAAAVQLVLLNNPVTTNGAFSIMAPPSASARVAIQTRGTVSRAFAASRFPYINPFDTTYVISAVLNNGAADWTTQIVAKLNGLAAQTINDSIGSTTAGNFSNAALHIGSQFGSANFFNGRLYGLIVRGATSTAPQVASTEVMLASRSGMLACVRTEGDSYMGGSGGVVLPDTMALTFGRVVQNTGVGSSDMAGIRTRVLDPANAALLPCVTVFWDGSSNGYVSNPQYLGELQDAITALGHNRFVVIPPAVPYATSPATQEAIAAGMLAAWPNNYLDWRSYIPNTGGVINLDRMLNYPTDTVHLNQTAMNEMSAGINAFITAKGW